MTPSMDDPIEHPLRFDAVLLDFDGTVVNTLDLILESYRHTMRVHLGHAPPDEAWLAGVGQPLVTQLRTFARSENELEAMRQTYRSHNIAHHDDLALPFEEMRPALEALEPRLPLGLVTSKARMGVDRGFATFDLGRFFRTVVSADDVVRGKPAPEPVLKATQALGVEPRRCLMVGDSPHDIVAGRSAGTWTAVAGWGAFDPPAARAAQPDYWLDTPRALVDLVLSRPPA